MKNFVVTINRTCGSGGSIVGSLVSKKLGVPLYDKATVLPDEERTQTREAFSKSAAKIREMAESGSFVIVGRCADYVLRDAETCVVHE